MTSSGTWLPFIKLFMINDLEYYVVKTESHYLFVLLSCKCVSFLLSNKPKINYAYPHMVWDEFNLPNCGFKGYTLSTSKILQPKLFK